MKMTLFLGAGASVFAGMPTTKDLVRKVRDRTLNRKSWESSEAKRLAVNIVEAYNEKDVEELYDAIRVMIYVENQHLEIVKHKTKKHDNEEFDRVRHITSDYPNDTKRTEIEDIAETIRVLESIKMDIRDTLLNSLMVNPVYLDTVVSTYDELFKSVPRDIITTNYDNVLETYCKQVKLDLVNGFESSYLGDSRTWNNVWKDEKNSLRLIKMHGSVTWQKDDNDAVLEISRPGLRDADRDVMIAPTLGEKDYGDSIFPPLMDRFKTVLDETELLIVVGFSFKDPEIKHMILNRLKRSDENPCPMRLLYVDPIPKGLKELIGPNTKAGVIRVREEYIWRMLSRDKKASVYVYQGEFDLDAARFMNSLLGALMRDKA